MATRIWSKRNWILPVIFLLVLAVFAAQNGLRHGESGLRPAFIPKAKMANMPNHEPIEPQSIYCGLWRTDDGFVSTIHIKNDLIASPLTVTPILYMSDGTAVNLTPRHVPAGGEMDVNINRAIGRRALAINGHLSSFGSAELLYDWTSPGHIVGSMQILNIAQSLIFTDSFEPPKITEPVGAINHPVVIPPIGMHHIEMLWWKHDPGVQVFAGFTNTSVRPMVMDYTLEDAAGAAGNQHELMLGPHATQFLDLTTAIDLLPPGENTAGGISIQYDGGIGQLLAVGQMENPDIGYSDHMPYAIHDLASKTAVPLRIACTGLMTGKPDPMLGFPAHVFFTPYLVLRNAGRNPLPVRMTLNCLPLHDAFPRRFLYANRE